MNQSAIPALSRAKLKRYQKLHQKKYRDSEGLFLAEGLRTVRELCMSMLSAEMLEALLVREGTGLDPGFARRWVDRTFTMTESECAQLADTSTSQGIIGVFRKQEDDTLADSGPGNSFIVALDDVQDPGNVGTIMRTAVWFGADAVICSPGTGDPYNPKTVRSCAGSIYALRHYSVNSLEKELRRLSGTGFTIAASSLEGQDFREYPSWPEKLVLVIGNEANGVSRQVQELAHRLVRIPHSGRKPRVESLNAAVSAGILMERMILG